MTRFYVSGVTRDKEYDVTSGTKDSKVTYFTANPNGEAEVLNVILRPRPHLKKLRLDVNMADLAIKGRSSKGNILTKHLISKISQREALGSTLSARKLWFNEVTQRLSDDGRGELLGSFAGEDKVLVVYKAGYYKLYEPQTTVHFDEGIQIIEKFNPKKIASVIYFDGDKKQYQVKRFELEDNDKKNVFISEHEESALTFFSFGDAPIIEVVYDKKGALTDPEQLEMNELISVKGMKALGNKFATDTIHEITVVTEGNVVEEEITEESNTDSGDDDDVLPPVDETGQATIF